MKLIVGLCSYGEIFNEKEFILMSDVKNEKLRKENENKKLEMRNEKVETRNEKVEMTNENKELKKITYLKKNQKR